MFSQVIELRKQLEERWPGAQPLRHATSVGVPTGVAALDAILRAPFLVVGSSTMEVQAFAGRPSIAFQVAPKSVERQTPPG